MSLDFSWVSPHNKVAHSSLSLPKRIGVYDTTLRDGEQTAGVVFRPEDKIRIAEELDAVGVDRIEVGMPAISEEDRQAIAAITEMGLNSELWGFSRCREDDVDRCLDLGLEHLLIEYPISPIKLSAYNFDPKTVDETIERVVAYAKSAGVYVAFMFVDGTRAPMETLLSAAASAQAGGTDEFVLPDTVGGASPQAIHFLVDAICSRFDVPLGIHCHNEFGMATACTLAGVIAGANWVHTTVNGLGEKSGNSDMAEVVVAASLLYGIESSIDLSRLTQLAHLVEDISGVPLSPTKAVVGRNVFRRESGSVIAQMINMPSAVESYDPALVGQQREIVLGKKSGKQSIIAVLKSLGIEVAPEAIETILQDVKSLSLKNKSSINERELLAIVEKIDTTSFVE